MTDDLSENKIMWLDIKTRFILKDEIDLDNRVLVVYGGISLKSFTKFDKQLRLLENLNDEPITVIINSPGGSLYDGFAYVDRIMTSSCVVNTHGTGLVASAALPIFLAGEWRTAGRLSTFMHHAPSYGVGHEPLHVHTVELSHTKDLSNKFNKFLASRTLKPFSFWSSVGKSSDFFFDFDKALELGVVNDQET